MKIHVFHTGEVHVSPYLPFGGDNCNIIKASGITGRRTEALEAFRTEYGSDIVFISTMDVTREESVLALDSLIEQTGAPDHIMKALRRKKRVYTFDWHFRIATFI